MQRIVAGRFRGRKLMALPRSVRDVRPSSARVRSAIFDRLQQEVVGARVLDAFAGSGALAIEAISRGAGEAVCLERQPAVARFLSEQIAALALDDVVEVARVDAVDWLGSRTPRKPGFDLVLLDPPYARPELLETVCGLLVDRGWLSANAHVICEHERRRGAVPMVWPEALSSEARREHGHTVLEFLRYTPGNQRHESQDP